MLQKLIFLGVVIAVVAFGEGGGGAGRGEEKKISFDRRPRAVLTGSVPLVVLGAPSPSMVPQDIAPDVISSSSASTTVSNLLARRETRGGDIGGEVLVESEIGGGEKSFLNQELLSIPERMSFPDVLVGSSAVVGQPFYRVGNDPPPFVPAARALVADLRSGEDFVAVEPTNRWPLASLTKLVSAVVVLREFDLNQAVTIGITDLLPTNRDQERTLTAGDRYSARDLLRITLSASNNEAAEALASSYGRANFVSSMNNLARQWELENTNFDDPTGLSASNQSTLSDLKKLMLRIHDEYPEILEITRAKSWTIREIDTGKTKTMRSTNLFAGQAGFVGGKTGYTDEAGGNLVSVFRHRERPVLFVVLGDADRFGDTEKLLNWFKSNFAPGR